ncbi:MAG: hypothetical protein RIR87_1436 [Actinomycetota bacterium]|jgi:hypothetical protein
MYTTQPKKRKEHAMSHTRQLWQYYTTRFRASLTTDHDRGEVSATTVVMAAALIALALFVGATITSRVRDKANSLDLD